MYSILIDCGTELVIPGGSAPIFFIGMIFFIAALAVMQSKFGS